MNKFANLAVISGGLILGTYGIFKEFFYTVYAGERAIIYDKFKGIQDQVIGEGMHLFVPLIQVCYIN